MTRWIDVAVTTHPGRLREINEDRLLVGPWLLMPESGGVRSLRLPASGSVVAVFDGMGGHAGGALAAQVAAEEVSRLAPQVAGPGALADVLELANRRVYAAMTAQTAGMGSTVAAVVARDESLLVANVGDTRCYVESGSYLSPLTVDDARRGSGLLTQSLGGLDQYSPVVPHVVVEPWRDQRFLLASDGLFGHLPVSDLEACLSPDPVASVEGLLAAALSAGGPDNVTIALVTVTDDEDGSGPLDGGPPPLGQVPG